MASTYKHNRIDLARDAIRLLRLLKGSEGQPIRCELFETYLDKAKGMDYEALSYVWGTGQTSDKIWLDGYPFKVTKNLYKALEHLRRLNEDRLLWVDAICIDQSYDAVSCLISEWSHHNLYCQPSQNSLQTCIVSRIIPLLRIFSSLLRFENNRVKLMLGYGV